MIWHMTLCCCWCGPLWNNCLKAQLLCRLPKCTHLYSAATQQRMFNQSRIHCKFAIQGIVSLHAAIAESSAKSGASGASFCPQHFLYIEPCQGSLKLYYTVYPKPSQSRSTPQCLQGQELLARQTAQLNPSTTQTGGNDKNKY